MAPPIFFGGKAGDPLARRLCTSLEVELSTGPPLPASQRLARQEVIDHLAPRLDKHGIVADSEGRADFFQPNTRTSVSVHAGRAYMNNEVVWQLLRLANDDKTRSAVFIVPKIYKGSQCSERVLDQLTELAKGRGLLLALDWASVLGYATP